jgi:hypothetical protein
MMGGKQLSLSENELAKAKKQTKHKRFLPEIKRGGNLALASRKDVTPWLPFRRPA